MSSRTTRTTSRTIRTIHIRSPPKGGLLLERVLMVLEVVLVVLEVTGPQVPLVKFQTRLSLRPDLYSPGPPMTRTIGSITRIIRSSSRTTFKRD